MNFRWRGAFFAICGIVFSFCFVFLMSSGCLFFFFFFNDTATTEIYTLSLHDALPDLSNSFVGLSYMSSSAAGHSMVLLYVVRDAHEWYLSCLGWRAPCFEHRTVVFQLSSVVPCLR